MLSSRKDDLKFWITVLNLVITGCLAVGIWLGSANEKFRNIESQIKEVRTLLIQHISGK